MNLIGATLFAAGAAGAARGETVQIDNQRGEKVKFCTYRSDDKSLVRERKCWMMKPGRTIQWRREEDESAFDIRLFEPGVFELPICMKRNIRDSYRVEIAKRESKACIKSFGRQSVLARPWQRLDRVLVNWSGDRFWYPATIVKIPDDRYHVRFDNGRVALIEPRYITSLSIAAGARVEVNWKGQGRWYPGYVKSVEGNIVNVRFDDGFDESSKVRRIRLELADGSAEK